MSTFSIPSCTSQYSYLIATVVGSAVVPTLIANAFYLPRHLLEEPKEEARESGAMSVKEAKLSSLNGKIEPASQ